MFYISIKRITLDTVCLPVACSICKHENQRLTIYKKYLKICWVIMIPLRKSCCVMCPNCGNELTKKQFVMSLEETGTREPKIKDKLHNLIKNAQTPLYPKLLMSCYLLLIAVAIFQNSRDEKMLTSAIQEYCYHPKAKTLLVIHDVREEFSYQICFVKKITKKKALVFSSQLAYKYEYDARKAIRELQRIERAEIFFEKFQDAEVVALQDLTKLTITYLSSSPAFNLANMKAST